MATPTYKVGDLIRLKPGKTLFSVDPKKVYTVLKIGAGGKSFKFDHLGMLEHPDSFFEVVKKPRTKRFKVPKLTLEINL